MVSVAHRAAFVLLLTSSTLLYQAASIEPMLGQDLATEPNETEPNATEPNETEAPTPMPTPRPTTPEPTPMPTPMPTPEPTPQPTPAPRRDHDSVWVGKYTSFVRGKDLTADDDRLHVEILAVGRNDEGQLGVNSADKGPVHCWTPVALDLREDQSVRMVAAGAFHTLFLTYDGELFGAGRNNHHQLGDASVADPVKKFVGKFRYVTAGYAHTCVIFDADDNQNPGCIGWNANGQLGNDDYKDRAEWQFQHLDSPRVAIKVEAGHDFTFILVKNGDRTEVMAFGNNLRGQLAGYSRVLKAAVAIDMAFLAAGNSHVHLANATYLAGAGANFVGQVGDGTLGDSPEPVATNVDAFDIYGDADIRYASAVFAGGDSSCVGSSIDGQHSLQCTGSNSHGQIGLQAKANAEGFEESASAWTDEWITRIAVGQYHSLMMTRPASEYAWEFRNYLYSTGTNGYGQLGMGKWDYTNDTHPSCDAGLVGSVTEWTSAWRFEAGIDPTPVPTPQPSTSAPTPSSITTAAPTPNPVETTAEPSPTPTPAPTPNTSRTPSGADDNTVYYILGGGAGVVALACGVFLSMGGSSPATEDAGAELVANAASGAHNVEV